MNDDIADKDMKFIDERLTRLESQIEDIKKLFESFKPKNLKPHLRKSCNHPQLKN